MTRPPESCSQRAADSLRTWCQEEPQNQGAWYQVRHRLQEPLQENQQLFYAGRISAAAPASGVFKLHMQQQQALVEAALDIQTKATRSTRPKDTATAKSKDKTTK
mgnify:CR=1 FL=1